MQVFSQFLGVNVSDFWRLGFDGGVFQYDQYVVKVGPLSAYLVIMHHLVASELCHTLSRSVCCLLSRVLTRTWQTALHSTCAGVPHHDLVHAVLDL